MVIELNIQGYFSLTICKLGTEIPIEKEFAQGVLDSLQQGEYLLGIRSRTIMDINDLHNPLYSVIIEATENCEYEFEPGED